MIGSVRAGDEMDGLGAAVCEARGEESGGGLVGSSGRGSGRKEGTWRQVWVYIEQTRVSKPNV